MGPPGNAEAGARAWEHRNACERAGLAGLEMNAETLEQLLTTLAAQIPSFGKFISTDGQGSHLRPAFAANLNGDQFSDPRTPLAENDCVMILSWKRVAGRWHQKMYANARFAVAACSVADG
jgi:hypothetical protein